MTTVNSTARPPVRKAEKPAKPTPDFPLFPHNNGQWVKKVRGKLLCFGVWADPQAALNKWDGEKDDLLAGRVPRVTSGDAGEPQLHNLVNQFLTTKKRLRDVGGLSPHTWKAYDLACGELIAAFGRERLLSDILPADFEQLRLDWGRRWSEIRVATEMVRIRVVFNFAYKQGIIDRPIRYGEGFKAPSKKTLRLEKAARGPKMFEARELRRMIDGDTVTGDAGTSKRVGPTTALRPMLLLAINAGLGNSDLATMPLSAINLETGWVDFPRPKTGISRRFLLWPETLAAVKSWLAERPTPKSEADAGLLFLTVRGVGWSKNVNDRAITHECRKLLDKLGIGGKRNIYGIRHSFETVAGESRDQVAVDYVMGHTDESMGNNYRGRISDERLRAVTECVRDWLFSKTSQPQP
jgi:integrase